MSRKFLLSILCTACLTGGASVPASGQSSPPGTARVSGVDLRYIDNAVLPQDDFYRHINGKWLADTEIPPDKGRYGSFDELQDASENELRGIVEHLQTSVDAGDPDQRKIADLYFSFMDEAALEAKGLEPLTAELAKIDAISNKSEIPALIAHLNRIGVGAPFTPVVHLDAKDPTRYVFDLGQDGLGMPDRDYYLLNDDKMKHARDEYGKHVQKMLGLSGDKFSAADAAKIIVLETALAKIQWTQVENRDPAKAYNKFEFAKLSTLAPAFDWKAYLAASGVAGKTNYLIISQPSYIKNFGVLLQTTSLPVWKAYFRWRLLGDYAPYLARAFVEEHFVFYGTALRGIPQNVPRWKRAITVIENSIGEGLGKLYVAQYFPPEAKARIDQLVQNLLAAYKADIGTLDWMTPQTKQKALEKLAKFKPKIGYPAKWRDYGSLKIDPSDLVGNVERGQTFEYDRNLAKLGKPVDRDEWGMTPQTVNAYYNPEMNEIVFPAAILRPPFFDPRADDAVNYGGIGGVIGHEISHGFDDQGSQYDGDGILLSAPGWFSPADLDKFKAKTQALVVQYASFEPVPGYHVNGELTLGENIADNAGLAIAHKAYVLSLAGADAPVLDGMSGNQRFFAGWAQAFRGKSRVDQEIVAIKTDPHSPSAVRGTVPEMNQDAFYATFGVKAGDKMYLAPDKRVSLW